MVAHDDDHRISLVMGKNMRYQFLYHGICLFDLVDIGVEGKLTIRGTNITG